MFYAGQKFKYNSTVTRAVDNGVVLRIYKDTSEDPTCDFYYTIWQSNGVTQHIPEEHLSSENCLSSSPPPS